MNFPFLTIPVAKLAACWVLAAGHPCNAAIVAAEYYINVDPGPGKGVAVPGITAGDKTSMAVDVSPETIAGLPPGPHLITLRVRDEEGDWSVAFTRMFSKEDPVPDADTAQVSHIEYRWMQNGGQIGTTVRLDPAAPAAKVTFDLLASLRGLTDGGTYQLVATPFDTRGTQGMAATTSVKIETVDSDGDGLPDLWEMNQGLDPALAGDAVLDPDGDGLTNLAEFAAKTNPQASDTSGDGINDKLAIDLGLDPLLKHPAISNTLAALQGNATPTAEQVRALHPGRPVLSRNSVTGKYDLRLGLRESADLRDWRKLPVMPSDTRVEDGEVIFSFSGPGPSRFYRVDAGE